MDRAVIVRAALELLDEVGLDKLSTRRLAERLGVQSPALYWHFRDKPELLDLMAQELLRPAMPQAAVPLDGDLRAAWREQALVMARERRRLLLSRRDGARLIAGTRPGPDAADAAEAGLTELVRAGMDPATALHSLIAISHFVTGFVLEEQAAATREVVVRNDSPGTEHPLLFAALATGGPPESDRAFEYGVQALIDGLARQVPGSTSEGKT